jgi:HEXXH motif-containing protein
MESIQLPQRQLLRIDQLSSITPAKLEKALRAFALNNKILVYQHDPSLAKLLDINDDGIFLEPLLFGFFNNLDNVSSISLLQVLYGYIEEDKRPARATLTFTHKRAYLPNLGTFELMPADAPQAYAPIAANLLFGQGRFTIETADGKPIPFRLTSIQNLDDFELVMENHPLFYKFFRQANPEIEQSVPENIDAETIAGPLRDHVEKALDIIRDNCPAFFELARLANSKIVLFDCEPINSFATKNLLGAVFLSSSLHYSGVAFYIDDLVHQMAHNILNALIFDKTDYFKVDVEALPFAPYSTDPNEKRDIFNTFHGLLTCSFRVSCFRDICRNAGSLTEGHSGGNAGPLTEDQRREIVARYIDQDRRYKNGPRRLPIGELFTENGSILYKELDRLAVNCLGEIRDLIDEADFSNQVSRFNYNKFLEKNQGLNINI